MSELAARRGTTNGNARGSSEDRRRRREWLVATYRADVDLFTITWRDGTTTRPEHYVLSAESLLAYDAITAVHLVPACRCYRCGELLTVDTVTVDRIIPGCQGGTYRRTNIRPACGSCNSQAGGGLRSVK